MEYTIQKLGRLAGVSTRTLRYYDEIDILKPARINSSGYRIYGQAEVDLLQQILFFKELGVGLDEIKQIIESPNFNGTMALKAHREKLLDKKRQLELLIENVEKTLAASEGRIIMSNKEKFEGFKQKLVENNEKEYGAEIRKKYGNDVVEASNKKVLNMSEADQEKINQLTEEFNQLIVEAFDLGDPGSEIAQKAAALHKEWLCFYWPEGMYTPEAHYGLAQMYVEDERFTAYYDKIKPGVAVFLKEAVKIFTGC